MSILPRHVRAETRSLNDRLRTTIARARLAEDEFVRHVHRLGTLYAEYGWIEAARKTNELIAELEDATRPSVVFESMQQGLNALPEDR